MNNADKSRSRAQSRRQACGSSMLSEQAWAEIARSLRLSLRELQVLRGVFDDHTEFAIAAGLRISRHTVHTHVERLYHKLAVTDRMELVLLVVREFLRLTVVSGSVLPPICASQVAGRCPLRS